MAAGQTYTPIATQTLSSATAGITFSSISSSYTDLVLIMSSASSDGASSPVLQFNGNNTGTAYSFTEVYGTGTTSTSTRGSARSNLPFGWYVAPSTTLGSSTHIVNFMNYSNTTTYKTILARENNVGGTYPGAGEIVGLWQNTNAISSIYIYLLGTGTPTFSAGSIFTLYGIAAA